MIRAESASLVYSDHDKVVHACREIDLTIGSAEFTGILGPSGSGKSSLLYILSGLKVPTEGRISYDGQDLNTLSDEERSHLRLRNFGFIFQQPYLLGYLTAIENVLLATQVQNPLQHAEDLLAKLGLQDKMKSLPHELSGGERQRVCVARALIGNPRAIFADEPTASLDHANGLQVVELLNEHRGTGSLIMVTHDPTMLEKANRVLQIIEGRVEETQAVR
ncbi:MAG: ABC transporter ATP-binding protein [Fimbriimonadaceae bacterium]|nr:ABC transporter ATP-binding protein [Fimbriimonadaceae bacterium]